MAQLFNKVVVIGVGLIGGSFAKGIKTRHLANEVVGYGPTATSLQKGVALGVLDSYTLDLAQALDKADLVMLAVPMGAMQAVFTQMQPLLQPQTIVTDAGSSKMSVIHAVESVYQQLPAWFVPGHPIAGKEQSGVEAASETLFEKHKVILTPEPVTDASALARVQAVWQALGAQVSVMTAQKHDEVLAATSHLPHLLAFTLVDLLNEHSELGNVFQYTAGGFRDFSRIASSDATMWRDIALNNAPAIVKWMRNYQHAMDEVIALIESENAEGLFELFAKAKLARDTHIVNK